MKTIISPHGTIQRYMSQSCRCKKCRRARRDYDADLKLRHERGEMPRRTVQLPWNRMDKPLTLYLGMNARRTLQDLRTKTVSQ